MATIESLQPEDWTAAMQLALAYLPEAERHVHVVHCLGLLANGLLNPNAILIARDENRAIVGVQVCVPIAGSSCLFWLPSAPDDIAEELVRAALQACRTRDTKIAQLFTTEEELSLTQPLQRQGFRHVTRMHQMRRGLEDLPPMSNSLRWETVQSAGHAKFAGVLARTYEGTLDCPELNGRRTLDEIIAGHQNEGKFNPENWWLAYQNGQAIGVVMLVELNDGLSWDLSYLGIVPQHRGLGHGRELLRFALHHVGDQMATRLLLSVDDRNTPALNLYRSAGFVAIESQEILLCFFDRAV